MANVVTGNPFYIDTTGTAYTGKVWITAITAVNRSGDPATMIIDDTDGREIISTTVAAGAEEHFEINSSFNGLAPSSVATNTHFKVYIR